VYSLGVLLYELLVGALPHDSDGPEAMGFEELMRRIREDDPPTPSRRLASLGDGSRRVATHGGRDLRTLGRELRGDLDWIVMKALEKNPNRRYGSPAELIADIRRHLTDEPVTAGPPNAAYRARKFARRHRLGVAVATTAVLALAVTAAGTAYGMVRALRAEREAQANLDTATRVANFLVGLFDRSDPFLSQGREVTAREVLDVGANRLDAEVGLDPDLRRRMEGTLGRVYANLGDLETAEAMLRSSLGDDTPRRPEDLDVALKLGWVVNAQGRPDEAERIFREVLANSGDDPLRQARALIRIGHLGRARFRYDEAVPPLTRAIEILKAEETISPIDAIDAADNLAGILAIAQEFEAADDVVRWASEIATAGLGPDHPQVLRLRFRQAVNLYMAGLLQESHALADPTLSDARRVLGDDHVWTLDAMLLVAGCAMDLDRPDRAIELFDEYTERYARAAAPDHVLRLAALLLEANALRRAGRLDEAERSILESRRLALASRGASSDLTAASYCYLGAIEALRGDRASYRRQLDRCFPTLNRPDPDDAEMVVYTYVHLAEVEARIGEHDAAIEHLRRASDRGFRLYDLSSRAEYAPLLGDPRFEAVAATVRSRRTSLAREPGPASLHGSGAERGPAASAPTALRFTGGR
jgi:non-specific serine/threonine protein kinase/serine/threonine-protein kinase